MIGKSREKLVQTALDAALHDGADEAEGFLIRSASTTVEVDGGKPENIKVRESSGIGVRVLDGTRLGFAHTSDLTESGVKKAAKDALANAASAFADPFNRLPKASEEYPDIERFDENLASIGLEERIEKAILLESSARDYDKRIARVRQASISDTTYEVHLASSGGISICHRATSCSASLVAVAESDGDAQMGWDFDHSFRFADLEVEPTAINAAQKAVGLLGARQAETTSLPVILDSPVASEFLAAVAHALMADQVQKGKSLFADKIGHAVASKEVTIIDDGAFEGGISPAPADGEGTPSRRTLLIEDGTLNGFLHNAYTANKGGCESTGNGVRSSYASLPEVGASNLYLVPGDISRAGLIEGCSKGFLVTDAMGMHTINMVSGDFSVGASGLWIENGRISFPVRETTIAGNVKNVLADIRCVADDLKFHSRYGSPTIMVGSIVVSGK